MRNFIQNIEQLCLKYLSDNICLEVEPDLRTLVRWFRSNYCDSLHWNNIGFNKNYPIMASSGTEMSHILEKVPSLITLSFSLRLVQRSMVKKKGNIFLTVILLSELSFFKLIKFDNCFIHINVVVHNCLM